MKFIKNMSRLGKLPIELPTGTEAKLQDDFIVIKGPKGELKQKTHPLVQIKLVDKQVQVDVQDKEDKTSRAMWGLYRMLIQNMVDGVNKEFEKKMEINGVGYRASSAGKILTLNVGYSHPVDFNIPEGISAAVEKNIITISGIDKQLVGETAARIRKVRKPEPYKGKGIKYVDEVIRRKAGKTAAS